jgi:hypothetical protein
MEEQKKPFSLNLREKRARENCKCKQGDSSKECKCGHSKGESSFTEHFNDIFNRR